MRPSPSPLGSLRFWVALLGVSLAAALFAILFRSSLTFLLEWTVRSPDVVSAMHAAPWWARLLLPAAGALAAGAVVRLALRDRGGGVGYVMEAVVIGRIRLSMQQTLLKSLASWFAIVSGGSIGKEGPLIQFGGAAGKFVGDRLRLDPFAQRVLIAAGTAAGFAAAYNTPFAAVLFVLEVVTGVVVLDALIPTLVATAVATAVTRAAVGEGPIYGARTFALHAPGELFAFALLGALAALAAQGFMYLLGTARRILRSLPMRQPWRAGAGGLLAGILIVIMPDVAGNGAETLNALLDGSFPLRFVAALLVAKCLATSFSVASGSPGGVFTPTLLLGGGVGLLAGAGLGAVLGGELGDAGGYALVGMAATTAATTHAPLMAAVMVFELSGDYAIVLPLVVATGIATLVSRAIRADSIYTAELTARGIGWRLSLEGRRLH